ncbi:MAG: SMI1/KNR4 family protein [Planctomycetes bacterium]|nr:SMI1/KNR4 family protein [Planctomycetota bacterium]
MSAEQRLLIERARAEHSCRPGASADALAAAEARLGMALPPSLRELLGACNGIDFWRDGDYPCRLLSAEEIAPARLLLHVGDGPAGLLAVLDNQGAYVALDVDPSSRSHGRLIDCHHETFPFELPGICDSVWELLRLVLDSNGEDWSWPAVLRYGVDFADPGNGA